MTYHRPVLLKESVDFLNINPSGVYVDATFGGGGHSAEILSRLGAEGKLFGFDQDEDALRNVVEDDRFQFVQGNFRYLKRFLRLHGIKKVDGVLADLGVSSHQFDEAERGFSYRFDSDLDMRMNRSDALTAAKVVNTYSPESLQELFSKYGEVRNAKTLAQTIRHSRENKPLASISEFLNVIDSCVRGNRNRYLSQVFQAIRIEVNEEIQALEDFLNDSKAVLNQGARLVIISYHSLEDRMVKNFLKAGNVQGKVDKDFYGNINRPFKIITKKVVLADEDEIKVNSRARSAKMRVGERKV